MRNKNQGRVWWWLTLFVVAGVAVVIGFFLGMEKGRDAQKMAMTKQVPAVKKEEPQAEKEASEQNKTIYIKEIKKEIKMIRPISGEDSCARIEKDIQELFRVLNKKNYILHVEEEIETYKRFKKLVKVLSAHSPIPAGEGIDTSIMTKNIYHFFRLLKKNDIRILKAVMRNEADTLEMNMDLFFKWFMMGNRCPDPEGVRPSLGVMYQYAGFFLNTIGGRSYLFRRPVPFRLLMSYYSILIIHEADKRGKNNYGIDIFSQIASLAREIGMYPEFHYQNDYLHRLNEVSKYYLQKRE